jgi:hypothetical protein
MTRMRKVWTVALVLLGLGVLVVPAVAGGTTTRRYLVQASTSNPTPDCEGAGPTLTIPVTAKIEIRGIVGPTYVAASYVGGPDNLLDFQSKVGNTVTYTGSVVVPTGLLCDDPGAVVLFRVVAANGPTTGAGSFAVQAAPPPGEQRYVVTAQTSSFPGEAGPGVVDCSNPAASFAISTTVKVKTGGIGRPTSVVANYLGGSPVSLAYAFAQGDTVAYRGSISVPRSLLCDQPPSELFFQATASKPGASGSAGFVVRSIPPKNPAGEYLVSAAATPPQVNCLSPDATFPITVTAVVSFKNMEIPETVVANYLGGTPVTLTQFSRTGYIADYSGVIDVPRELLCDPAPSLLAFTATATRGPTSGSATFYVNSVAPPSENAGLAQDVLQQQESSTETAPPPTITPTEPSKPGTKPSKVPSTTAPPTTEPRV